jgi:peptidoglycan hydrolase-like protein with peptidoglycan-binding domain
MKHRIALAAITAALALTSPAFAGTGPSATPAPVSRQAQIEHRTTMPQTRAVEGLYRRAQQKLVDLHLYNGAVDGRRSEAFVRSVEHFQREHNIRANGRLNSETRAALGI